MSEIFGFDLLDKSKELIDKELLIWSNRIQENFLSYVSVLNTTLILTILDLFLRDKNNFPMGKDYIRWNIDYRTSVLVIKNNEVSFRF